VLNLLLQKVDDSVGNVYTDIPPPWLQTSEDSKLVGSHLVIGPTAEDFKKHCECEDSQFLLQWMSIHSVAADVCQHCYSCYTCSTLGFIIVHICENNLSKLKRVCPSLFMKQVECLRFQPGFSAAD